MPTTTKEQRQQLVHTIQVLLSAGHPSLDIHKAMCRMAPALGMEPPTYRTTLRWVGIARRDLIKTAPQTRDEMRAVVTRSLWDLRKDKNTEDSVKLGALREISRLWGLHAPAKAQIDLTSGGIPLATMMAAVDGDATQWDGPTIAAQSEVVDGNAINLLQYLPTADPAAAEETGQQPADDEELNHDGDEHEQPPSD